jgi:hypothetical protein
MPEELKYSNPRMSAIIENWPSSFNKRVTAVFAIEQHPKRGERAIRSTAGATKKLTFSRFARIVDGSDGRTYIAGFNEFGSVSIMRGDMKLQEEWISSNNPRYREVLELFADVISEEWRNKLIARG